MNLIFVLLTAITVSIDSFVAGFSLALNKQKNITLPLTVALVTFWMCLSACFLGNLLRPLLLGYVRYVGAAILFGLGICNLLKKESAALGKISFSQCLAIGCGVGLDGAAAALSLVLQGMGDTLFLSVLIAATHFVTVFAGQRLAQIAKPKHANVFSAAILFVLGALKLCDL